MLGIAFRNVIEIGSCCVNAHGSEATSAPHCADGHCVTCADEGIPMRLVRLLDAELAVCEAADGQQQEVLTGLLDDVRIGDMVLVHAGTALTRLDRAGEVT